MEITEVRIKLMDSTEDRLRGFCSITFDNCFVVRDLKIIEGKQGPFVAMPSRKLTSNCPKCRSKNHLRAHYCNQCGYELKSHRVEVDSTGRAKLYADIAHPVNARCREMIQNRVVEELNRELELATKPGYKSRYDDDFDHDHDIPDTTDVADDSKESKSERTDPGGADVSKPHDPQSTDRDSSTHRTDGSDDEFGSGIF